MRGLLGDEYESFVYALTQQNAKKGFRINTIKADTDTFTEADDLPCKALSYVRHGFVLEDEVSGIGNTPMHAAGRIYVQDPGAMASAAALDVEPDMRVCDLCAAPGGKSTQIAAYLGDGGFILSNEYVPKRAKILVGNFERMGIRCGVVISLDTSEIAKLYENFYDIVVADAPCSGEGMFRKDVPAAELWSEENVRLCKGRQGEILENAAKILRCGGKLLYSTCTYSLEENEMVVDEFLKAHPDFELCEVKDSLRAVTADGIVFDGALSRELYKCRRFYPHKADGEGQFLALLCKKGVHGEALNFGDSTKPLSKDEMRTAEAFLRDNLLKMPDGRICKHGENIVIISHGYPIPPRSVFSAGVLLGEIRGKNLFPSHQFFSSYGYLFKRKQELGYGEALRYMRGEEIDSTDFSDTGWCVLTYNGSTIGGGKASGGKIKNHYPKGLRIN